ncbi:nicotinate-nucleotide--dimethylbenzimidazole phosphoribosyltransferase, partial [Mesorhizobium sp. M7A.F.Ca.US.006.04.2.1]
MPTPQGGYAAYQIQGMIDNKMTSALPFDDFRNLLANLPAADTAA